MVELGAIYRLCVSVCTNVGTAAVIGLIIRHVLVGYFVIIFGQWTVFKVYFRTSVMSRPCTTFVGRLFI